MRNPTLSQIQENMQLWEKGRCFKKENMQKNIFENHELLLQSSQQFSAGKLFLCIVKHRGRRNRILGHQRNARGPSISRSKSITEIQEQEHTKDVRVRGCSRIDREPVWLFPGDQGQKKVSDEIQEEVQANTPQMELQNSSIQNIINGHLNVLGCGLGPENKEINKSSLYPHGAHRRKQIM